MTGKAAVEASQSALDLMKKQEEAARALGKERLNAGASAGSHSIGYRQVNKYMTSEAWSQALSALGSVDYNKIREGRMEGLFDLSIEQLENLQKDAPLFWAKLDDDVREYLETIIACGEKTQEMIDIRNETLTQISFDSLFDEFLDTLSDMDASSKEFAENFEAYMQKAIIRSLLVDNYQNRIKQWYEAFSSSMANNTYEQDYENLKDKWDNIVQDAIEERNRLMDTMGWTGSDDTNGVSGKLNAEMTEGTASELVGLWNMTAMDIRSLLNLSVDHFSACRDGWQKINEIVNILNSIDTNTGNTATNTGEMVNKLEQGIKDLKDELSAIKTNTKNYNGRG